MTTFGSILVIGFGLVFLVNRAVEDFLRRLIPADELTLVRPPEVPK